MIISQKTSNQPSLRRGYGAILMVLFTGIVSLILLQHTYDVSLRSLETQKKAQLQLDYNQKEQAFLTSLVGLTPKFLANNMIDNSLAGDGPTRTQTRLGSLTNQAAVTSKLQGNYNQQLNAFGLNTARSANTGINNVFGRQLLGVVHPTDNPPGWTGQINATINGEYPPVTTLRGINSNLTARPNDHPAGVQMQNRIRHMFLSSSYTYDNTDPTTAAQNAQLQADSTIYPEFNLIPYPNISFGYAAPGQPIVAKQNWWRLFMQSEIRDAPNTGLAVNNQNQGNRNLNFIDREYILSVYEIPSQLAINSNTFTQLGSFGDGTSWADAANIGIQGGIYSERLTTSGELAVDRITTKETSNFDGNVRVGEADRIVDPTTGITTANETTYENQNLDFFPIAKSSDSAKSIFVSLGQGPAFFDRFAANFAPNPIAGNRASYEHFFEYSRGCNQTAMKLDIFQLAGSTPIELRFTYLQNDGTPIPTPIRIGGTGPLATPWPNSATDPGFDTFPFFQGVLPNGDVTLNIHLDRIAGYLATLPDAAGLDINHSITVNPDHRDGVDETGLSFDAPVIPTPLLPDGTSPPQQFPYVVLIGTEDLTAYTSGFSYVSNLRTYFKSDFNNVPYPAGTPARPGFTDPLFPPTSVFAPEIRYGTEGDLAINVQGSVGSLADGNANAINVLDLRNAQDAINTASITASLESISHPAQLPPVNVMNWLIVVNRVIK